MRQAENRIEPEVRPARNSSGLRHASKATFSATSDSMPNAVAWARVTEGPAGGPQSASSAIGAASDTSAASGNNAAAPFSVSAAWRGGKQLEA